jgi:hypothetical protein
MSRPQDHSATGRIMSMKISNHSIGNWTCDPPACSAVPDPNVPPRAARNWAIHCYIFMWHFISQAWKLILTGWKCCFLVWHFLPIHWRCKGLLLRLITLNDTQSVGFPWGSDRPNAEVSTCKTHHIFKRYTSTSPEGFEPAFPASKWLKTYALESSVT